MDKVGSGEYSAAAEGVCNGVSDDRNRRLMNLVDEERVKIGLG